MKRALLFVSIVFCTQSIILAQEVKTLVKEAFVQKIIAQGKHDLDHINYQQIRCGLDYTKDDINMIKQYINSHPEYKPLNKKLAVPQSFNVGDKKSWWVLNDVWEEIPSTCKAVGKNCYIFVSDASWTNAEITQDQIDDIVHTFDDSTPAFPDKGIYDVCVDTFGEPPDFDGNSKIIIFFFDIQDDYESTGVATAGYFRPLDQYSNGDPAIGSQKSNEADIFYIDTHPLLDIFGMDIAKTVLAHEFQHMIHWHNDFGDMTFINEGLSEIASYICGYSLRSNSWYTQNTNRSLLSWDYDDTIPDYSRAAFWTLYAYEQFPIGILKDFVNNHHSQWGDIDATFKAHDANRGFFEVFEEWLIANYVNSNSADAKYMYQYSPLSKPAPVATYIGNPNGEGNDTLVPLGAQYIKFSGGSDLTITFTGDNTIRVRALKIGSLEVVDVPTDGNTAYSPTGFGTTYPEVTFLVYNQSPALDRDYSYVATGTAGTMELAYDDGTPDKALNLSEGSISTAQFDGIPGGIIDSLKVGFLNIGNIDMGFYKFRGGYRITGGPFGDPLITDQTLNVLTSSNSLDPFDNWVTIDLSTQNIDATDDFIVAFTVGSDNQVPGLMASAEPDDGLRQYTYATDQNPPDWYWYGVLGQDNYIWKYLIRAYVTIGKETVAIDQTGIVTIPDEFSLEHNYPNPFNPSTTFRFSTPKDGLVKFTVHDLLGRVIYSENRNLFAGNYSFTWNGQNQLDQQVVSGVYFLRMEAEGYSQTRKMLLLR